MYDGILYGLSGIQPQIHEGHKESVSSFVSFVAS